MALTNTPPWLSLSPELFLNAAASGARTGQAAADALNNYDIHRQEIASHAATAAAQIGAEREKAAAEVLLAHQRLNDINEYRSRENDLREKGIDIREAAAALRTGQPFHVGDSLVQMNPDGTPNVIFSSGPTAAQKAEVEQDAAAALEGLSTAKDRTAALSVLSQHPKALSALKSYGVGLLPTRPTEPRISVPVPGASRFGAPTHVSGPISAVLPLVGTNAPSSLQIPPAASPGTSSPQPRKTISTGDIIDDLDGRYRFNGGDPKDKGNWELIEE